MAKHFEIVIGENSLTFSRRQAEIDAEAALDGIYVIRTSVRTERLDAPGVVTAYKGLSVVERDFRSLKAIDLDLRPIYHFTEDRVRAHVFICMLAAYLVWHLRRGLGAAVFHRRGASTPRRPCRPRTHVRPRPRPRTPRKETPDGETVHDLSSLLNHLATLTRNTVVFPGGVRIDKLALPTPLQRRAFELIGAPIPNQARTDVDRTIGQDNDEPPDQEGILSFSASKFGLGSQAVTRIRAICLGLPEAVEKPFGGHTSPAFRVRDKMFAVISEDGTTMTVKAPKGVVGHPHQLGSRSVLLPQVRGQQGMGRDPALLRAPHRTGTRWPRSFSRATP